MEELVNLPSSERFSFLGGGGLTMKINYLFPSPRLLVYNGVILHYRFSNVCNIADNTMLNSSYFSYVNKIFSKDNSHLSLLDNCSGAIIFSGNSFLFAILNIRWAYSICLIQWPIHRKSIKKCKSINWQVKLGRKAFLTHPSAAASNIKPPFSFYQSIVSKTNTGVLPQQYSPEDYPCITACLCEKQGCSICCGFAFLQFLFEAFFHPFC